MKIDSVEDVASLAFQGATPILPVIVQHHATGEVLMLGYADEEALRRCLSTGELWLWSRSRRSYWRKGETSGNTHAVTEIHTDCDRDAVLILARPDGPTCHTGEDSCFGARPALAALERTIADRAASPTEGSYTARLLADSNLRLKKLGEETVELVMACAAANRESITEEAADLIYHTLVACAAEGVPASEVLAGLDRRRR